MISALAIPAVAIIAAAAKEKRFEKERLGYSGGVFIVFWIAIAIVI